MCSPRTSWEFVVHFDYEYSIIKGTRKFTWTSLVSFPVGLDRDIRSLHAPGRQFYVGCRWCTLSALIVQLVGFDISNGINCQV
jgi:hypothetical protein